MSTEWDFFVGCCKSDDVDIGAVPQQSFVDALNAALPYGAHIDPRPVGVLEPGGAIVIDQKLQHTLQALPPSARSEVGEAARQVWRDEAYGMAPHGATDAMLRYQASLHGVHVGLVGATPDPYPPSARPEWLKPFAHVTGTIPSAPLDLAARMDRVVATLRAQGWTPVVRSIGTDFQGPLGMPVPKDQPLDMLLHRTDHAYTADDAQKALSDAIKEATSVYFSPTGAWLTEVVANVVQPTITQAANAANNKVNQLADLIPWLAVGLVGVAAIKVLPSRH